MTTEVKPGQVWASKNTGSQWEIEDDGEGFVFVRRLPDGLKQYIRKTVLVDDYVLVREAPSATARVIGGALVIQLHGECTKEEAAQMVVTAINEARSDWGAEIRDGVVQLTAMHPIAQDALTLLEKVQS